MSHIAPMLCESTTRELLDTKDWSEYVAEIKIDGMRAMIHRLDDTVLIYGRSGKEYSSHLPHLVAQALECLPPNTIIDGELAYITGVDSVQGKNAHRVSFNKTMRVMGSLPARGLELQESEGKLGFLAFDILKYGSLNTTTLPFTERRSLLEKVIAKLRYVFTTALWKTWSPELFDELTELKHEGLVLKKYDGVYTPGGRNKTQVKVKSEKTADVVIMYAVEGMGRHAGRMGAVVVGVYDEDGNLNELCKVGGGFLDTERTDIWNNFHERYEGMVIEIKFNDLVGSGEFQTPRHPNKKNYRFDKTPAQCLREQFRVK